MHGLTFTQCRRRGKMLINFRIKFFRPEFNPRCDVFGKRLYAFNDFFFNISLALIYACEFFSRQNPPPRSHCSRRVLRDSFDVHHLLPPSSTYDTTFIHIIKLHMNDIVIITRRTRRTRTVLIKRDKNAGRARRMWRLDSVGPLTTVMEYVLL